MRKGDRVYSIGLHSRNFGIGRIESYSVDVLRVVEGVKTK